MKTIADLIKEFPFFRDFPEKYHALIGACGKNCLVKKGEYIAHEGDPAEALFLLKRGRVAIEAYKPGEGSILVETLGPGEV
ncbi:MAG: cyclic nucleotide-binding domain-containing protein, partial [Bdellovibrionales bacterium]|nr:cyclic nucleotide-binding domain-containing protein [Bdellovibrionales bacterium]